MVSVLLIYATTGGNTALVSQQIATVLETKGHAVILKRAERTSPDEISQYDACLLACPTYGHGLLQYHMTAFMKSLKGHSFPDKPFAIVGLGDDKYDSYYHIESSMLLEDRVKQMGGRLLIKSLRINKSPVPHLKGAITKWAESLAQSL